MSDPLFFSFNTKGRETGRLICHAVIFTTFEVSADNTQIKICTPEDDPRMPQFIRFVTDNYVQRAKDLQASIKKSMADLDQYELKIAEVNKLLNAAKEKAEQ